MLKCLLNKNKIIKAISFSVATFILLQNVYAADTGKMACKRAGVKEDTFMNIQTAAFETIDNMLPIKIGAIEIDNINYMITIEPKNEKV